MKEIEDKLYEKLEYLGIINGNTRNTNVGESNYAAKTIQPWSIWLDYPELTSFDHDIIKRVLRTKKTDSRRLDYEKIIHICKERIRQIDFQDKKEKAINEPISKDFLCVRDWIIDVGNALDVLFIGGKSYRSEKDGYIKDERGVNLMIGEDDLNKYFKRIKE